MARVLGLIGGACAVLVLWLAVPSVSRAAIMLLTQGQAYSYCQSHKTSPPDPPTCSFSQGVDGVNGSGSCLVDGVNYPDLRGTASRYVYSVGGGSDSVTWCIPATCNAGTDAPNRDVYQQWSWNYADGDIQCNDGCVSRFRMPSGAGIWSMSSPDGSLNASWGRWDKTGGGRCSSATDAGMFKPNYNNIACGNAKKSCFDPTHGFCAVTQSGEQVCTKKGMPGDAPAGCQAGATGAVCNNAGDGAPPPTPPDPPVSKGTPPDNSQQATGKDNQGNTYNYTSNSYSGTSEGGSDPDPNAAGNQGPQPDNGTTGGGTQSNKNGSGNAPAGGSTSGGAAGKGQCADGTVPTASGCSGTATDLGCDVPPQCFGDAVMCGQFRELHAIKCNTANPAKGSSSGDIGNPADALAGAGVLGDGGASSDPSPSGLVTSSDIGEDGFDASGLGFSRSCPASPTFQVLGHSYTLDLTPFCNFAGMLGWFVLLVAFLVGLRIVATGKA